MAEGFICRRGGGIKLPDAISAGNTPIYEYADGTTSTSTSYVNAGTGFGITAVKAGTYRFKYAITGSNMPRARLTKNGIAVSGSEITTSNGVAVGTFDVALSAGDVVRLQRIVNNSSYPCATPRFVVGILATALQNGINNLVTGL